MSLLMASNSQQNQNGKYIIAVGVDDDKGSISLGWEKIKIIIPFEIKG